MAENARPLAFRSDFFDATNAPARRLELVPLDQYKQVMQRTKKALDSIKGDFLPLAGVRGIGKTCCLEYVARQLDERGVSWLLFSDDDLNVPSVPHSSDNQAFAANYVASLTKRINGFMEKQAGSVDNYKSAAAQQRAGGRPISAVLLLDNLDRIFPPEQDDEKEVRRQARVRDFFARLDSRFKVLKDYFFVIIACDPKWAEALKEHDFNYLKYDNRIHLSQISLDDMKRILAARLSFLPETDNPTVDKYWEDDFLRCLLVEADGITRDAILLLEKFNEIPVAKPFKVRDYERLRASQLYEACRSRLIAVIEGSYSLLPLARDQRNRISHGIELLRRSADACQRAQISVGALVTPLAETFNNRQGFLTSEPEWLGPWKAGIGFVQRRGNLAKLGLVPDVQLALEYWKQSTHLDIGLLAKSYFDRPFTRWFTDIRDDVAHLKEESVKFGIDVAPLDELERHFGDLALSSETLDPDEVVIRSARMLQLVATWYAAFTKYPKPLTPDSPPQLGEALLEDLHRRAHIEFQHDADIKYVNNLWLQIKKAQAMVARVTPAQAQDASKKASRVVAAVLRNLKPERLTFRSAPLV